MAGGSSSNITGDAGSTAIGRWAGVRIPAGTGLPLTTAGCGSPRETKSPGGRPAITMAGGMKIPPRAGCGCPAGCGRRRGAPGAKAAVIAAGLRCRRNAATGISSPSRWSITTFVPSVFVLRALENITNVHVNQRIVVNNITIINNTKNITNITYVNNRAVNRGVPVQHVQAATGRPVKIVHPDAGAGCRGERAPDGGGQAGDVHPGRRRSLRQDAPDRKSEPSPQTARKPTG